VDADAAFADIPSGSDDIDLGGNFGDELEPYTAVTVSFSLDGIFRLTDPPTATYFPGL
jgi:hypothetical protein